MKVCGTQCHHHEIPISNFKNINMIREKLYENKIDLLLVRYYCFKYKSKRILKTSQVTKKLSLLLFRMKNISSFISFKYINIIFVLYCSNVLCHSSYKVSAR